jgi:hypothetical protein
MDNKTEQLIWKLGQPPMGGVKSNQNLPEADVELGLGIRIRNNNNLRIDTKLLQEMEVEFPDADHAVLRWEMTKGTIKASRPNGIIHKWKLDRKLGYAPVSFMIYVYNLEGKQDLTYEMTMSDFRRVDGLMMPFKMEGKAQKWREGKPEMVQMLFVNVKEYRFNDPKNIPARYPISWPKGMIPEKPKKP